MIEMNDEELLAALGIETALPKTASHTPYEERLMAGFEEIVRFYETHHRAPQHGAGKDIFERLYAVRLDQLRKLPEAKTLLANGDKYGLLSSEPFNCVEKLDEQTLLAELGFETSAAHGANNSDDINVLRYVRSSAQKRAAAEEVAARIPCADFDQFQVRFEQAERELKSGLRKALRFGRDASVAVGNFFILGGQLAYVAAMDEPFRTENNDMNARLRVIYSNATESNLLLRSLQRALYKDETGRRLSDTDMGPLFSGFGDAPEPDDIQTGSIYVLRSLSSHPFVAEHRELIQRPLHNSPFLDNVA